MAEVILICCRCGGPTLADDERHAKQILDAAKVNGAGPYCDHCRLMLDAYGRTCYMAVLNRNNRNWAAHQRQTAVLSGEAIE